MQCCTSVLYAEVLCLSLCVYYAANTRAIAVPVCVCVFVCVCVCVDCNLTVTLKSTFQLSWNRKLNIYRNFAVLNNRW